MAIELFLAFHSTEDLRAYLDGNVNGDTLLIPSPGEDKTAAQFTPVTLFVSLPSGQLSQGAQILQVMPGGQLVVNLTEPAVLIPAAADATASPTPAPPLVSWTPVSLTAAKADGGSVPDAYPENWPVEQLQTEWNNLTVAQRITVARRGKLGARRMILKGHDQKLHQFVLQNPRITPGEVASMAGMTSLAPDLLKRIATQPEFLRHTQVVRNLVCNPKLPLDVVQRLLPKMPNTELRQLSRGGRVRQSVKRMIIKKVSGGR